MENKILTNASERLCQIAEGLNEQVLTELSLVIIDRPADMRVGTNETIEKIKINNTAYLTSGLTLGGLVTLGIGAILGSKWCMGVGGVVSVAGIATYLKDANRQLSTTDDFVEDEIDINIVSPLLDLSRVLSEKWQEEIYHIRKDIERELSHSSISEDKQTQINEICMRYSLISFPPRFASEAQDSIDSGVQPIQVRESLGRLFKDSIGRAYDEQKDIFNTAAAVLR